MKAKLQYLCALVLFGTTGLVLRWTAFPSELMVFLRGLLGAGLLLAVLLLQGGHLSLPAIRANLRWLLIGGISLGINWVFLFAAYRYTTVAIASLCNYTAPILVVLLSPLLFHEKLTPKKLGCVLAAAVGILMISNPFQDTGKVAFPGLLMGMGAALGFAGIIVCNQKLTDISPTERVIVQLFVSALVVLPYVLYRNLGREIPVDGTSVFWLAILVVLHTGVAYTFYFGSMGELPVQDIAVLGYLEPVVSVLCSACILSEPLGWTGIAGSVLILSAAIVSELSDAEDQELNSI